jgi:rSAM/selenodomain-associated transferase 2
MASTSEAANRKAIPREDNRRVGAPTTIATLPSPPPHPMFAFRGRSDGDRIKPGITRSGLPPGPRITVVVPALNEAAGIAAMVNSARQRLPGARVIVVDGGSADDTPARAQACGAEVLHAPRGRGRQCRVGADAATTPWLLFLHADTHLPESVAPVLQRFLDSGTPRIATFRLRFDRAGRFLRLCAWCTRFDSVFTRFGDQGILVHRDLYAELGGFPPWPLFEDVEFLRRARRAGRIPSLPAAVTTSARRFDAEGAVRRQWRNGRLLARFLLGESPEALAAEYRPPPPSGPAVRPLSP